jgi:hypothetical protein
MQTGSSGTLIGWKSGQTTFVPLWDRMEGERGYGLGPEASKCLVDRVEDYGQDSSCIDR